MRIVFFGSPQFAVPTLEALADEAEFEIALVVTQGAKEPSPVERAAQRRHLPVYRPATLKGVDSRQPLLDAQPDLFVVAAFGLILRPSTLAIPRLGSVNVHPSLLPRYRGASPIMAAIESGDRETGVSLMVMDSGVDTGDVFSTERVVVANNDTTESLGARLAEIAATKVVQDIPRWARGELPANPQSSVGASMTRTLVKADGQIDWSRPAAGIERHVRSMWPWPRAWTTVDGGLLQVHAAQVVNVDTGSASPGEVVVERRRIVVATGDGALEVLALEPSGRRAMTASAYLNGRRSPMGRLGAELAPPDLPPLIRPV